MQEADDFNDLSEVPQGRLASRGNLVIAGGSHRQGVCAGRLPKPIRHDPDLAGDKAGTLPIFADGEHR